VIPPSGARWLVIRSGLSEGAVTAEVHYEAARGRRRLAGELAMTWQQLVAAGAWVPPPAVRPDLPPPVVVPPEPAPQPDPELRPPTMLLPRRGRGPGR
jgi:hypothetical protein